MSTRPAAVAVLPTEPGVYRFRDGAGRALYIGRASNLRRRVSSYWGDLRDRPRLRRMVLQIAGIEALVCASEHEAAWLERNLLEHRKPRWNRARGGQELPAYIRLDAAPAAPRLDPVFTVDPRPGVRFFGPYLGSRKVRAAVAALTRCYPLAYTSTRLTPAERDMAAMRGVAPDDREMLVAHIAAVLEGSGEAAPQALERLRMRREEASAGLFFEIAAAIQDELEGLAWVVAPQRVTVEGAPDLRLAAWHEGLSVRFGIRAGRLYEWTQVAGGEAARPDPVPSGWEPFLKRNAALAAQLATFPSLVP
jgi:excinuclease UvrABC nuclease subunit